MLSKDAIAILRHLRTSATLDGLQIDGADAVANGLCILGYVIKSRMPNGALWILTTKGKEALNALDDPEPLLPLPAPPLTPFEYNVLLQLSGVGLGMRYSDNWSFAANKLKAYRYLREVRGLHGHRLDLTEAGRAYLREQMISP